MSLSLSSVDPDATTDAPLDPKYFRHQEAAEGVEFVEIKQRKIIFLVGPPCSGKTRFCLNELDGIRRASFDKKLFLQVEESNDSDIDEAPRKKRKLMDDSSSNTRGQTDVTLHAFIKSIAFFGDDVVVDDCNHLARLRQSFTSVIFPLPDVSLQAVEIRPIGGLLQCRYQNEFNLANQRELEEIWGIAQKSEKDSLFPKRDLPFSYEEPRFGLIKEYEDHPELLTPSLGAEGFSSIALFKTKMTAVCEKENEFKTKGALLVDLNAIAHFVDSQKKNVLEEIPMKKMAFRENVAEGMRQYASIIPLAPIIIVVDEDRFLPGNVTLAAGDPEYQFGLLERYRAQIRSQLESLRLPSPLFFYWIYFNSFEPESFERFPNLGPFAFLQRRHHIDLSNSILVMESVKFGLPEIEVKVIDRDHFFDLSGWDFDSKIKLHSVVSTRIAKEVKQSSIEFDSTYGSDIEVEPPSKDYIPLVTSINAGTLPSHQFISKPHDKVQVVEEPAGRNRKHGVIVWPILSKLDPSEWEG